jgi:hypothetical protein
LWPDLGVPWGARYDSQAIHTCGSIDMSWESAPRTALLRFHYLLEATEMSGDATAVRRGPHVQHDCNASQPGFVASYDLQVMGGWKSA